MSNYTTTIGNNGKNPSKRNASNGGILIPELPNSLRIDFSLADGAGTWINIYQEYAQKVAPMTPILFHESAALWLGSVAIARRLVLNMAFGRIFPNLFVLWNANSTIFRKSTGLEIARGLASEVFPFLLAAHETTPEAMLSDMAGAEPSNFDKMTDQEKQAWQEERNYCAQRGLALDEMSGLLSGMGKDYNAGLLEALLRFYDCGESFKRSTKIQGRIEVKQAYLSILGASTPAALASHLQVPRLWANGFWPRFAILTPDVDQPDWKEPVGAERPANLVSELSDLFHKLSTTVWPNLPTAISVELGNGVHTIWSEYNKAVSYDLLTPDLEDKLFAAYGRLPTQVLKVSMILAAFDRGYKNVPRIEIPHIIRSIHIVENWRASLHRTIAYKGMESLFEQMRRRIVELVAKNDPIGISYRDITRNMRDKEPEYIEKTLKELLKIGELIYVQAPSGPLGGRPTQVYKLNPTP